MSDWVELFEHLRSQWVYDFDRLEKINAYSLGKFPDPYHPAEIGAEYKLLSNRAVSNWCMLPVEAACQAMSVDGFRPAGGQVSDDVVSPEWAMWQRSNLDAKQSLIYRDALIYGTGWVCSYRGDDGKVYARGLSPLDTAAYFEDPGWDDNPVAVLHRGQAFPNGRRFWDLWTRWHLYRLVEEPGQDVQLASIVEHDGQGHCPVTRFPVSLSTDGRTCGLIEPIMPLQDRINQTVFDLLVAQTYTSFQVQWITGLAPQPKFDEHGEIIRRPNGEPEVEEIQRNPSRIMVAESTETKFGQLPGASLNGFIDSLDLDIRHFASLTQTPPHFLLGQIANLSAEALQAAELSFTRKVSEFQRVFGEAWERVLRLGMMIEGSTDDTASEEHEQSEVVWRDFDAKQLAATADGLGKLAQMLGVPARGLWHRIPGATDGELAMWQKMFDEDADAKGFLNYVTDSDLWQQNNNQENSEDTNTTNSDWVNTGDSNV